MGFQPARSVAYPPVGPMSLCIPCRFLGASALALLVANCAADPSAGRRQLSAQNQREIGAFSNKAKYGAASPRVVQQGDNVPKGGGRDHVGRPYQVAGRWYTPRENPGYSAVGPASWYGDAFHGRKTANGEIYDKHAYTAAHPTMPLPSYARVTNMSNGHSIIVRVNDRGPFHGGRIIDLSERVAHALQFKHLGTARVKVDYIQRASTGGSDDRKLVATLRTDGQLAHLDGGSTPIPGQQPIMVASNSPVPLAASQPRLSEPSRQPLPQPVQAAAPVAAQEEAPVAAVSQDSPRMAETRQLRRDVPLPPDRPFDLGSIPGGSAPMQRVNNGQQQAQPATVRSPLPGRDRIAAVYFAPSSGFADALSRDNPMARLRSGGFSPVEHRLAATPAGSATLQVGVFRDRRNAERLAAAVGRHGTPRITALGGGTESLYRLTANGFAGPSAADAALSAARAAGAADARLVR
jgi:rare lipoprotein A